MSNKNKSFDLIKYLPLGIVAVSAISGYSLLTARVSNAEDKLKSYEVTQSKLSNDTNDIKVSQAKTESKVDSMIEILKDIKGKL